MTSNGVRKAMAGIFASAVLNSACAQQADFNEVGRQMAIMLQNSHFARLPFNAELSKRFLDDYLRDLDFQRVYFTRQDVERFQRDYGTRLHSLLLQGDSQAAANEIYEVFRSRVKERVAQAEEILKGDFDFSGSDHVMLSRKDASWPADDKEAADLWKRQIKEAVLGETLRRELLTKLAKEQGKPDPGNDDRSPKEKVALRYKRFLASVMDVDQEEIANYFLSAVARSYDPHTDYMSYREMNRFKDGMKNELVGIGAMLQAEEDGATKIMGIVVGGPADREGSLKLNDRVVGVDMLSGGRPEDMTDIMFMKIDKVVDLIRGKEGTSVTLKVEPAGGAPGETKLIKIARAMVEMKDEQASGEIIEFKGGNGTPVRRIGIITLPSFYADFDDGRVHSSVDVEQILNRLVEEKIEGLILDLRNNGGGSLEEVRRMTGFFIEQGPVVQVKNTLSQVQVKDSDGGRPIYAGPMVVMTDRSSASASEILAGALQDYNRALIVGDSSTFGKGTVQQPMDIGRMLPLFSARNRAGFLKVTIQKFYRPSGSSTQLEGVKADVKLPSLVDALEMGEEYLDHPLPHDMIRKASGFKPAPEQQLFRSQIVASSGARVKANQDFQYVIEDVEKARKRIRENVVSLNKTERNKELAESNLEQKQRNNERRKRFAELGKSDKAMMSFYKITLDDLEKNVPLKAYDPAAENEDYMRRAKDDTEALDETPKWPSALDPVKRESIHILRDLVANTDEAKLTGITR
ncbi:MAG: carboxy terminal-processing peptidase [Verrucomicrobiota bacterium]